MPKMTDAQKRDIILEMLHQRDAIKTDEQAVRKMIDERLEFVPNKKLYKFRRCSIKNFKTLEENCIWMPPANTFYDTFDCTINIDLQRNKRDIEVWLREKYPRLSYDLARGYCESHGVEMRQTFEDMVEYLQTCIDSNGDVIEEKEAAFLNRFVTAEERELLEQSLDSLIEIRAKFMEHEDAMIQVVHEAIEQMRTHMRDAMLVYCMAEHHDIGSLWENYADVYKGFCIEYSFADYAEKPFEDYKNLVYLLPITYRARLPYFDMVPFFEVVIRQGIAQDTSWQRDPGLNADLNMQLYYKKKEYAFEREWRFGINNKGNCKQYFPFVSALYAGKDMKPGNLRRLCSIARKLRVPVYKQVPNRDNNGFDYEIIREENV